MCVTVPSRSENVAEDFTVDAQELTVGAECQSPTPGGSQEEYSHAVRPVLEYRAGLRPPALGRATEPFTQSHSVPVFGRTSVEEPWASPNFIWIAALASVIRSVYFRWLPGSISETFSLSGSTNKPGCPHWLRRQLLDLDLADFRHALMVLLRGRRVLSSVATPGPRSRR